MDRTIPSWNEYFIQIAKVVATRSKDPRTKVGVVLVNEDNRIIGTGYNGFKPGVIESDALWERPVKYEHVVHAEKNAIDFSFNLDSRQNVKLYTTLFPCRHCMAEILKHPITEIYYQADYIDTEESTALAKTKDIQLILLK